MATSAARDATNAEAFMSAATDAVGVRPEILSGDEEGRVSFAGATAGLAPPAVATGPVLVVDIGGGSTELVAGYPASWGAAARGAPARGAPSEGTLSQGAPWRDAVDAVSLDVGCVRVTERFLHHDPPRPDELAEARAAVDGHLATARAVLPPLEPGGLLVGLAGTVSTLAALEHGVEVYDRARIHHVVLRRDDVERWLGVLGAEDSRARLARPGMVEGRADVIVGGVLVLVAVMADLDRSRCLVSEDDILDGLAAGLLDTGG